MVWPAQNTDLIKPDLQLVAWELTRRCNLFCAHCRAAAADEQYSGELSTADCCRIIDQISEVGKPVLILTGGEPLLRQDLFRIAGYAVAKGFRVVLGTNGTLLSDEIAARLKAVPVTRLGISLDFPEPALQDRFRGMDGAFHKVMAGFEVARRAGLEVQVNCTVTRLNVNHLEKLLATALEVGAVAFHPFMLVPTGRGKSLESVELSPEEYEQTLNWIYDKQIELGDRIFFKPTDAPHYLRIVRQRRAAGVEPALTGGRRHPTANAITRGCLAGTGFCFISHRGKVKGCGYLDVVAGDLRQDSFAAVWHDSPVFNRLRDLSAINGKCGRCEFERICGGCRARAYERTGDFLAAEPYCVYEPGRMPARL